MKRSTGTEKASRESLSREGEERERRTRERSAPVGNRANERCASGGCDTCAGCAWSDDGHGDLGRSSLEVGVLYFDPAAVALAEDVFDKFASMGPLEVIWGFTG